MRLIKVVAVAVLLTTAILAVAGDRMMPPNPDKIAAALVKQGVIPANASASEKEAAVNAYLKLRFAGATDEANPEARKILNQNEEILNAMPSNLRGRKLGNTATIEPSNPQFKPLAGTGKLLLILVEFSDTPLTFKTNANVEKTAAGPLHNTLPVPDNSFDLYINDFNTQHYEDMLFTPGGWYFPSDAPRYAGEHRGSMHDFYLEQSYGQYTVTGKAFGWFKVDKPEAYYGGNAETGTDNAGPGNPRTLITDAVAVINAQNAINWQDYDTNGDCRIDHPLFIHAGADESGGGGAQGPDAIWAHSSRMSGSGLKVATTAQCPGGLYLRNYTMMPEDGGVGVFAHEYGHDLGLPDEYDTRYTGAGDSNAFWTLMSSGSWVGRPAQTQPSDMSAYGKYALGWLTDNLAIVNVSDLTTRDPMTVRLEQTERWGGPGTYNAIKFNLPDKIIMVNTPHSGAYEWFGGKANRLNAQLSRTVDLTGKTSASLSFWTWYDIEEGWDFGFVQVSTDGGTTWTSLPLAGTTMDYVSGAQASIIDNLPGFTGQSGKWIQETADLSAYAGQSIQLMFRYMTDSSTANAGFYVDDISVVADGMTIFTDTAETLDSAWTATTWTRDLGYFTRQHYYLAEWRNSNAFETDYEDAKIVNFDNGLTGVYQFDPYASNPNEPAYFAYNAPGVLLWYRDYTYSDNWTGTHPGGGFLLVVDAHKQPLMRPPLASATGATPWTTRVQSYDAAFSLLSAPTMTIGYYGTMKVDPGLNAVPNFNDAQKYWLDAIPNASVITPRYGLLFRVLGQADDGSAALIGLGLK